MELSEGLVKLTTRGFEVLSCLTEDIASLMSRGLPILLLLGVEDVVDLSDVQVDMVMVVLLNSRRLLH